MTGQTGVNKPGAGPVKVRRWKASEVIFGKMSTGNGSRLRAAAATTTTTTTTTTWETREAITSCLWFVKWINIFQQKAFSSCKHISHHYNFLGKLITWRVGFPTNPVRDVAKKKTGKCGNFEKQGGGLPESHFHFLLFLTWETPQKKILKCKINHFF